MRFKFYSNWDVFTEKSWFFDERALFEHQLVNLEQILLTGTHTLGQPILHVASLVASSIGTWSVTIFSVCIIKLLVQNACISDARIEFYPVGRQHEVDETVVLITPELDDTSKLELRNDLMSLDDRVHICLQTEFSVHAFRIKFNLNETVWIRTDDKIYFSPINHDYFLQVVDHIRQLGWH